ncbi:MAG: hypothetical protein WCT16_02385 [Candidatus Buchananbacteria bacterium]
MPRSTPRKKPSGIVDPYEMPKNIPTGYNRPVPRRSGGIGPVITVLIIIIIIIGALAAGYYLMNQQTLDSSETETDMTPSAQEATAPEQTAAQTDPAADWKTYAFLIKPNSTAATSTLFSFRHPDGLTVERNGEVLRLYSSAATDTQMFIYYESTTTTLDNYLKDLDKVSAKAWEGKPSIKVVTSTAGTLGGQPLIIREQKLLAADLNAYTAYILSDKKVFTVSLTASALNQQLAQFFLVFLNNFKLE